MQEAEQKRQTEAERQERKAKALQDEIQANIEVHVRLCSAPCLIPPAAFSPPFMKIVHCRIYTCPLACNKVFVPVFWGQDRKLMLEKIRREAAALYNSAANPSPNISRSKSFARSMGFTTREW
jgi:hypothetical protein